MFKPGKFLLALSVVYASFHWMPATAADIRFQLINDTEYAINLRFFSRGESHQVWPSKSKAFTLKADSAIQLVKLSCEVGEQICWGAWMATQTESGEMTGTSGQRSTVRNTTYYGVGDRGVRSCVNCCQVCIADTLVPAVKITEQNYDVK